MDKKQTWGNLLGGLELRQILLLIYSALLFADIYLKEPIDKQATEEADVPWEAFAEWADLSAEMQKLIMNAFAPSNMARSVNEFEEEKCQ